MRLNTLHNLHYFLGLMAQVRRAIAEDRYAAFAREFRARRGQETERTRGQEAEARAAARPVLGTAARAGRRRSAGRPGAPAFSCPAGACC